MNVSYRLGWHLAFVEGPLLVLGLGAAQRRLERHHALPLRRQAALFAVAVTVLAVPLVALEADLEPVVAAPGTVRGRPRVQRVVARAGRTVAIGPRIVPGIGHRFRPTVLRHHSKTRER